MDGKPFLILALAAAPSAPAETLLHASFLDNPVAPYDAAAATLDFGPKVQFSRITEGRARIKEDAQLGKVLEVKYPKGCLGSGECAIQLRSFIAPQESAWVQYKVRFEPGFSWQRGGKLPGLCGGQCNTGCVGVTGKDGWSARMMWRGTGRLVQYMYVPGKSSGCGDDYDWNMQTIGTGQWHELRNHIVLNTPGKSDGVMRSWLDGKMVLDRKNVRFRDIATLKIDQFYFSTFHGGSSDAWRPAVDSYISFSDIVVTTTDPSGFASALRPGRADAESGFRAAWSNGSLDLRLPSTGRIGVTVSDLSGRAVAAFAVAGSREQTRSLDLGPGVYQVRWRGPAGSGHRRLTVLP